MVAIAIQSIANMDEDDCSVSKPIEHALSTPSIVSGSVNMGPPSHEG